MIRVDILLDCILSNVICIIMSYLELRFILCEREVVVAKIMHAFLYCRPSTTKGMPLIDKFIPPDLRKE